MKRIPEAIDITVNVRLDCHDQGGRAELLCYRCGGLHHTKAECSSWRTRICSRWREGRCYESFCSFAHGEDQVRTPWRTFCTKLARGENGRLVSLGCGEYGHVYSRCPHNTGARTFERRAEESGVISG